MQHRLPARIPCEPTRQRCRVTQRPIPHPITGGRHLMHRTHHPQRKSLVWQLASAWLALALLFVGSPIRPTSAAPTGAPPYAPKELLFVSDGMRPDLAEKYAASGDMP